MIRQIILWSFILACASTHAANISTNKTIQKISIYANYLVIQFTPKASGSELEACPASGESHVVLELNESTNTQYSALLAAYTSGNRYVGFGTSGCRQGNGNNHPLVYRVDLGS